ncbi:hypothetical protein AAY473_011617 [Plecturocebus cupreus]
MQESTTSTKRRKSGSTQAKLKASQKRELEVLRLSGRKSCFLHCTRAEMAAPLSNTILLLINTGTLFWLQFQGWEATRAGILTSSSGSAALGRGTDWKQMWHKSPHAASLLTLRISTPGLPAQEDLEHFGRPRWAVMRSGVRDRPGQHGETLSLLEIQKIARRGGTGATWEAEAGESLESRRQRLQDKGFHQLVSDGWVSPNFRDSPEDEGQRDTWQKPAGEGSPRNASHMLGAIPSSDGCKFHLPAAVHERKPAGASLLTWRPLRPPASLAAPVDVS